MIIDYNNDNNGMRYEVGRLINCWMLKERKKVIFEIKNTHISLFSYNLWEVIQTNVLPHTSYPY